MKNNIINCLHKCNATGDKEFTKVQVNIENGWANHLNKTDNPIFGGFSIYKDCCEFKTLEGNELNFKTIAPKLEIN